MKKVQQLVATALIVGLTALTLAPAVPAYAQAVDGTLTDIGEGENRILTSGWQTLNAGQQITYQFGYDGDEQPVSVWMNATPADSANFQIWTEDRLEQLGEDSDTEPLGQGTPMTDNPGFTNWQGGSPEAETYYVVVSPTGDATARFLLNISSPALSLDQPGAVALAPVTPTVPVDPNVAVVTTDALNVRSGPSTAFPVLTTIPNGTAMTVLGRNPTNTWISVQLEDGTEGWVTRSLTSYTLVSPNVILPDPLPAAAAGVAANITATTTATTTAPITTTGVLTPTDLGDDWQTLSDGETDWYTFQYRGGELPLTIWMDLEPFDDAEFTIVNAETAQAIMAGTPPTPLTVVGSGRANPVQPGYLYWQAEFPEADTFYIMVEPSESATGDVLYSIEALGPGVGRVIEAVE